MAPWAWGGIGANGSHHHAFSMSTMLMSSAPPRHRCGWRGEPMGRVLWSRTVARWESIVACGASTNPSWKQWLVLCIFTVFLSHLLSSPFLSPSPSRNSDPGTHSRLLSPLSTTVRALHFHRENTSALSSLVYSRRIAATHARRSQQLIPFFIFARDFTNSPRWDLNSRINARSIRGSSPDHRDECII